MYAYIDSFRKFGKTNTDNQSIKIKRPYPCGSGNSAVPKGLQDVQRYTLVNKEKNGSLALVWVYTFTNADYEAAKARGAVHITLGEI